MAISANTPTSGKQGGKKKKGGYKKKGGKHKPNPRSTTPPSASEGDGHRLALDSTTPTMSASTGQQESSPTMWLIDSGASTTCAAPPFIHHTTPSGQERRPVRLRQDCGHYDGGDIDAQVTTDDGVFDTK